MLGAAAKDKDHQFENCLFKSLSYVRTNSHRQMYLLAAIFHFDPHCIQRLVFIVLFCKLQKINSGLIPWVPWAQQVLILLLIMFCPLGCPEKNFFLDFAYTS